jgi:hypothetical protein
MCEAHREGEPCLAQGNPAAATRRPSTLLAKQALLWSSVNQYLVTASCATHPPPLPHPPAGGGCAHWAPPPTPACCQTRRAPSPHRRTPRSPAGGQQRHGQRWLVTTAQGGAGGEDAGMPSRRREGDWAARRTGQRQQMDLKICVPHLHECVVGVGVGAHSQGFVGIKRLRGTPAGHRW